MNKYASYVTKVLCLIFLISGCSSKDPGDNVNVSEEHLNIAAPASNHEHTMKIVVSENGTMHNIYYTNGEEVAKEKCNIMDEGDTTIESGKIPDGIIGLYTDSGLLLGEFNYKNGKKEGIGKRYSMDRKLDQIVNYKNGRLDGLSKSYYKSGSLMHEGNSKDGKMNGINKMYYENGDLKTESTWRDGMPVGVFKMYDENGKLTETKMKYNK